MPGISRYQLNHPKAYLGYALALAEGGSRDAADELTIEYITGATGMARRGAENLGLVSETDTGYRLTERGVWVTEELPQRLGCSSVDEAFAELDRARGARERFIERYPQLAEIAPAIGMGDETIRTLIKQLRHLHARRVLGGDEYAIPTNELFHALFEWDAEFAGELFIRPDDGLRSIVCGGASPDDWAERDSVGQLEAVEWGVMPHDGETTVYRSTTTFQLKTVCWHLGLLQSKGTQANELVPREELWAVETGVNAESLQAPRQFVPEPEREVV